MNKTFLNLRCEMLKNGETQKDLAQILNARPIDITRRFNKSIGWKLEECFILAQHYDKSIEYLFKDERSTEQ